MPNPNAPLHPIIYVRGYAMTPGEIDDTTADPFCGFNLGSTVYRAVPDKAKQPRKYIFESPLVRLASDFGYQDVYSDGYDIMDSEWSASARNRLSSRSIIIFRYYDEASRLLGDGKLPSIRDFAAKLRELIVRVRNLVCENPENGVSPDDFKCYLVAHSMGGLVCRAFLQDPNPKWKNERASVDKFFTYATPHNGIEVGGLNIPAWLNKFDMSNFNREKMARYLHIEHAFEQSDRVDWLPEGSISPERVFCMVGTNRNDYEVAFGMSRTFVGHGSDGLVRVENAVLCEWDAAARGAGKPCAKAYAYRSHSGYFGIVNSEEAYQNLTRFLFGDVRVDLWLDVDEIVLPKELERDGKEKRVDALYQFEVLASPRGKLWYLTRRTAEEDSVACLRHRDWVSDPAKYRSQYVSTVFLANRARVNPNHPSLAYCLTLGIRVPDYEIDRKLWIDDHYEGGYLFRDSLVVELEPPGDKDQPWGVKYVWQGGGVACPATPVNGNALKDNALEVCIPFGTGSTPRMSGKVRLVISAWNNP